MLLLPSMTLMLLLLATLVLKEARLPLPTTTVLLVRLAMMEPYKRLGLARC